LVLSFLNLANRAYVGWCNRSISDEGFGGWSNSKLSWSIIMPFQLCTCGLCWTGSDEELTHILFGIVSKFGPDNLG
jgi:hypothetical protein